LSSNGKISPSAPIHLTSHLSLSPYGSIGKLSKLEAQFARFLNVLRRICVNTHFLEAFKEAPTYLKFLRELLFKKGKPGDISVAPIGEACSAILQSRSPSKL